MLGEAEIRQLSGGRVLVSYFGFLANALLFFRLSVGSVSWREERIFCVYGDIIYDIYG